MMPQERRGGGVGADAAGRSPGRPLHAVVVLADPANPFWHDIADEYRREGPQRGVEVDLVWPEPGRAAPTQLVALQRVLERPGLESHQVVVVNPMGPTSLAPLILAGAERGITFVDVGAKCDPPSVAPAGHHYVALPTVDFEEQGRLAAECVLRFLGPEGGPVAIIEGRRGARQSVGRVTQALRVLQAHSKVEVVARESADFARDTAATVAQRVIEHHPRLAAFLCVNDLMALGVSEVVACRRAAAEAAGAPPRPIVVGIDGIREAREAVKRGQMDGTVAFLPAHVVELVLDALVALASGHEIPRRPVASRLVVREDLE